MNDGTFGKVRASDWILMYLNMVLETMTKKAMRKTKKEKTYA